MAINLEPTEKDISLKIRPSLSFEKVTFSDGSTIDLESDDIVVFVGPNNAGKSAALRELDASIARSEPYNVIKAVKLRKAGNSTDFLSFLEENSLKTAQNNDIHYTGMGYNIHKNHVNYFDYPEDRHPVAPFFSKRVATETRITDSNPAPNIALHQTAPTHPIHLLLIDEELAEDISKKFRHAFNRDLTVFRAGGASFPLYVGEKPTRPAGKDELSKEFTENLLRTNVPLALQGDGMRSFATVLLHVIAAENHSVQFLDEPEAFLHPPQARLLGKYIAGARRSKSQLFIATHSTDVLEGLIEGSVNKVRIVRIQRIGQINKIKELSKERTREIASDTLTRFSGVFSGLFFQHVIVSESDADCLFYSSLLHTATISGDQRPDVLFVHAAGKNRMAKIADTLRALDVPVSVIADIDILSEEVTFRDLYEKLGGIWTEVQPHWKTVSDTVTKQRPPLNAAQVSSMIGAELTEVSGVGEFPKQAERAIKQVFKTVSPWNNLKLSGRSALPSGPVTKHFNELYEKCANLGLWIVPEGELEGFCRSIEASHGPSFVEKVLEERDLESDPELRAAREFVSKIWKRARLARLPAT